MTTKERVPKGSLCDHCHDPKKPLTDANAVHVVPSDRRDSEGREITAANVHRECADEWMAANR
jgi:hypothetical protein